MLTGLEGTDRAPTFALMVTDRNDRRGTALWSGPVEKTVVEEAVALNRRLQERGLPPRYRVEKRFPVSLAMVFSGDGSAWNKKYADEQERRNNGC